MALSDLRTCAGALAVVGCLGLALLPSVLRADTPPAAGANQPEAAVLKVEIARARLLQAKASYQESHATHQEAQARLSRLEVLKRTPPGHIPPEEFGAAILLRDKYRFEEESRGVAVKVAEKELQIAERTLASASERAALQLEIVRARVAEARARYEGARAVHRHAQARLSRLEVLKRTSGPQAAVSHDDFDAALLLRDQSKADEDARAAALRVAEAELRIAELDQGQVTAPPQPRKPAER